LGGAPKPGGKIGRERQKEKKKKREGAGYHWNPMLHDPTAAEKRCRGEVESKVGEEL